MEAENGNLIHHLEDQIIIINTTNTRLGKIEAQAKNAVASNKEIARLVDEARNELQRFQTAEAIKDQLSIDFQTFSNQITDLKIEMGSYLDALEHLYDGKITRYFLDPETLLKTLKDISKLLPKS